MINNEFKRMFRKLYSVAVSGGTDNLPEIRN